MELDTAILVKLLSGVFFQQVGEALALHSVTIAIITAFRTVIVIIKVVFRITSHFKQPFNGTFSIGIVLTHFLYIFSSVSIFAYYALHEFTVICF